MLFKRDQCGLVSIFVTMIMMLVISLIVLSFGQLSRRGARIELNHQNAVQAYYAAESGINDAISYINRTSFARNTTACGDFMSPANADLSGKLGDGVSYSCLLVSPTTSQLTKSPLSTSGSVTWPLKDASGQPPNSFTFNWQAAKGVTDTSGCPSTFSGRLPSASDWKCRYGILRVDLVRLPDGAGVAAATDTSLVRTLYLAPQTTATPTAVSVSFGASAVSNLTGAGCTAGVCSRKVDVDVSGGSGTMYARFSIIYQPTEQLAVVGRTASGAMSFVGAQVTIDATGKAVDQVKRIRETVSLNGEQSLPYALASTDGICKLLAVTPGDDPAVTDSCPTP